MPPTGQPRAPSTRGRGRRPSIEPSEPPLCEAAGFWEFTTLFWFVQAVMFLLLLSPWTSGTLTLITQALVISSSGFALSLGIRQLLRTLMKRRPPVWWTVTAALAVSYLLSVPWSLGLVALAKAIGWEIHPLFSWSRLFSTGATTLGTTLAVWCAIYLLLAIRFREHLWKLRISHVRDLASKARLEVLHHQVSPHFLFNVLNSIYNAIDEDADSGKAMVQELARYFRSTLELPDGVEVSLERELELVRHYLAIEQRRFGERLTVHWDLTPVPDEATVPILILQPLVENAIKHGRWERSRGLRLEIRTSMQSDTLVIEVSNDGQLRKAGSQSEGLGLGIPNVHERLRRHYGAGRSSFSLSERGGRVLAKIEVPASRHEPQELRGAS